MADEVLREEIALAELALKRALQCLPAREFVDTKRDLMTEPVATSEDELRQEIAMAQAALTRALDRLPAREDAIAEANFRTEAVQIVVSAVLASITWRGLDRRKFRTLVREAGANVPDHGPSAVQHEVLLTEARKVLEIRE